MAINIGGFFAELEIKTNQASITTGIASINRLKRSLDLLAQSASRAARAYRSVAGAMRVNDNAVFKQAMAQKQMADKLETAQQKRDESAQRSREKAEAHARRMEDSDRLRADKALSSKQKTEALEDRLKTAQQKRDESAQRSREKAEAHARRMEDSDKRRADRALKDQQRAEAQEAKAAARAERDKLRAEKKIETERKMIYNRGRTRIRKSGRNISKGAKGLFWEAKLITGLTAAIIGLTHAMTQAERKSLLDAKLANMNVKDMQAFKYAAQVSGVSSEGLLSAIANLDKSFQRIKLGEVNEQMARSFALLGINFGSAQKMSNTERTSQVYEKALSMKDERLAAELVGDLLGEAGKEYFWYLKMSGDTLNKQLQDARQIALTDEESKRKATAFAKESSKLMSSGQEMVGYFFSEVGDALMPLIKGLNSFIASNKELIKSKLADWAKQVATIMGAMFEAGKVLLPILEGILKVLSLMGPLLPAIAAGFALFKFGQMAVGVGQFALGLKDVLTNLRGIQGASKIAIGVSEAGMATAGQSFATSVIAALSAPGVWVAVGAVAAAAIVAGEAVAVQNNEKRKRLSADLIRLNAEISRRAEFIKSRPEKDKSYFQNKFIKEEYPEFQDRWKKIVAELEPLGGATWEGRNIGDALSELYLGEMNMDEILESLKYSGLSGKDLAQKAQQIFESQPVYTEKDVPGTYDYRRGAESWLNINIRTPDGKEQTSRVRLEAARGFSGKQPEGTSTDLDVLYSASNSFQPRN